MERTSMECRKNQNQRNYDNQSEKRENITRSQSELKTSAGKRKRPSCNRFSLASDWSRRQVEFFVPITGRSKAKPQRSLITFDTQLN